MIEQIVEIVAGLIAVIFIFAPHEFAHAFVAYKCGDGTAKMYGRLTLNPIKHLDPAGFIMCALTGFGWAKPVPINPSNFRHYKSGLFFTAIAGVVTNYIISFLAYPIFLVLAKYAYGAVDGQLYYYFIDLLTKTFFYIFAFGLSVFVFNLLPFYPLDGFRVVESFTREVNPVHKFLKNYGMYILIILIVESFLCGLIYRYTSLPIINYFDILGWVGWFAQNIIGFPITALWGLII